MDLLNEKNFLHPYNPESYKDAVFAINKKYKITLFNSTIENLLGYSAPAVLGKHVDEVINLENDFGKKLKISDFCFLPPQINKPLIGVTLKGPNGISTVNARTSTIQDKEGSSECLVTITDTTRERAIEKAMNEFVSVAAHELRTPMTIIKSYLWMLDNGKAGDLSLKQKEYIYKATAGTERMLKLIHDILDVSKIEQGRLEIYISLVSLTELIEETVQDLKLKADEKNISLTMELSEDLRSVYADKGKVGEILENLISNAIKFTDKGGVIVKAVNYDRDEIKVFIIDTGKGIEREDLGRLFHKFGRLDNSYETVAQASGSGLGLYIAKTYLEKMGGSIDAFSPGSGKGTTFWFTLPAINKVTNVVSTADYINKQGIITPKDVEEYLLKKAQS